MKEIINTSNAPAAIGPYSQGVKASNLYFFSGQLGLDPKTGAFASDTDVAVQCEQVFANISALLAEAGLTYSDVVKVTVFMADMGDFAKVNEIYGKYFTAPFPARSAVAVKTLPKGGLVEIEVIACK